MILECRPNRSVEEVTTSWLLATVNNWFAACQSTFTVCGIAFHGIQIQQRFDGRIAVNVCDRRPKAKHVNAMLNLNKR